MVSLLPAGIASSTGPRLEHQGHFLTLEQVPELVEHHRADPRLFVGLDPADFADPFAAVLLDDLVLDAAEDLHIDDHTLHARWDLERAVLHVLGLLAEDRGEQLLFRRKLGLALGRDLADQDVARLHMGTDPHDAAFVEVDQRLVRDVGDFPGDLFLPALGVADVQLELLDVDGRVDVVLHQAFRQDDRVLEVVPVPGHERHEYVAAQRQLARFGRGAVGDHMTGTDPVTDPNQGTLIDRGVLIGAPELPHPVAIMLRQPRERDIRVHMPRLARVHDDLIGRHASDASGPAGHDHRTGVRGHLGLKPGAHDWRLRKEQGHSLALHVAAHERAVGIVVLKERNQRRRNRDQLLRCHVHEIDPVRLEQRVVVALPAQDQVLDEFPVLIQLRIGLCHRVALFLAGGQPADIGSRLAVLHHPVRRLDEAKVVDPPVGRQTRDQADVRAFRRLDRTHPAILRVVHVANLEPGALAGEAARPEGREPPLVGQLGERVRLVHELRQL